jgi:hypothetical protein
VSPEDVTARGTLHLSIFELRWIKSGRAARSLVNEYELHARECSDCPNLMAAVLPLGPADRVFGRADAAGSPAHVNAVAMWSTEDLGQEWRMALGQVPPGTTFAWLGPAKAARLVGQGVVDWHGKRYEYRVEPVDLSSDRHAHDLRLRCYLSDLETAHPVAGAELSFESTRFTPARSVTGPEGYAEFRIGFGGAWLFDDAGPPVTASIAVVTVPTPEDAA